MATTAMIPVKTYNLVDPETGATVVTVPPGMVAQFNQQMQGPPGAGTLGTLGDALQIGAGLIEQGDLRDLRDDIADSRRRLQKRRDAKLKYLRALPGSGITSIDPLKLADFDESIYDAQEDLDRSQTRAIGTIQDNILINVFGAGARVVGRMQGEGGGLGNIFGGGGGGGASTGGLIVAGGLGALLYGAVVDDDGGGRGGRRGRRE